MSVPAPHFLLYPKAVCRRAVGTLARSASEGFVDGREIDTRNSEASHLSQWRFVLRLPGGEKSLEAADVEDGASTERLELLAIIRGLESLDQPSRVTLVASGHVERGLKYGLAQWRENDWQWER